LHKRADSLLIGGGQLLQRELRRPHAAFVEPGLDAEAERRVSAHELVRALEETDDIAVLGTRGIPYQVFGDNAGAAFLMIAWSRWAMARSCSGISAIFATTSLSPSALPARAACTSRARSFIAARSSSVNHVDALLFVADRGCVRLFADFV
jgi:hypothetical protein